MNLPTDMIAQFIRENEIWEGQKLCPLAFSSTQATRKLPEIPSYRPPFTRDADRIIHSFSFARFFDKTQVFFWVRSDLHQHRMLHVQLVAKIAREIAHVLKLNEQLTEAIALGHDIGHVPFGHDGEDILNKLTKEKYGGEYHHNAGSVWFLQGVEHQNLTLPVVDGILCHNGESHYQSLSPNRKNLTWDQHHTELADIWAGRNLDPIPKTLEGCLVRMVDTISYISRDVMDAESLGFLKFNDIPDTVKDVLGKSNRDILNSLISDIIVTSHEKDAIGYSTETYNALQELYRFNYKNIYTHPDKLTPLPLIEKTFRMLWDHYYDDLIKKKTDSHIYTDHLQLNLNQIKQRYPEINTLAKYPYTSQPPELIVRDFLAGMTDQYFWQLSKQIDPTIDFTPATIY